MNVRKMLGMLRAPLLAAAGMAAVVLASCFAPSVPDAPQVVSPLPEPVQAVSPLGAPGIPGETLRVAVIVRGRAYLPTIGAPTFLPCAHNRKAAAMLAAIANAEWQHRRRVRCHPLLSNAAQAKTDDMAAQVYAEHISPENVSPNDNVRAAGYPLPPWYEVGANNVESFGAGFAYSTPAIMLTAFATSPLHWRHISAATPAGPEPFFVGQECLAVGYSETPGRGFFHYWIVLSAPCPDGY